MKSRLKIDEYPRIGYSQSKNKHSIRVTFLKSMIAAGQYVTVRKFDFTGSILKVFLDRDTTDGYKVYEHTNKRLVAVTLPIRLDNVPEFKACAATWDPDHYILAVDLSTRQNPMVRGQSSKTAPKVVKPSTWNYDTLAEATKVINDAKKALGSKLSLSLDKDEILRILIEL